MSTDQERVALIRYLRALFNKTAEAHSGKGVDYADKVNAALLEVYAYGKRRSQYANRADTPPNPPTVLTTTEQPAEGETPETDAAVRDFSYRDEIGQLNSLHAIDTNFARKLERERNAARSERDALRAHLDAPAPDVEAQVLQMWVAVNKLREGDEVVPADLARDLKLKLVEAQFELTQEREHVWALYEAIGYSKDRNIQTGDSPFDCIAELTAAQTALKHAGADARDAGRYREYCRTLFEPNDWPDEFRDATNKDELDAAIDAALSASEPESGHG